MPSVEKQEAMVAGKRSKRQLSNGKIPQEAMVAGGHTKRHLASVFHKQEAMVAGVGFEPTTFRL